MVSCVGTWVFVSRMVCFDWLSAHSLSLRRRCLGFAFGGGRWGCFLVANLLCLTGGSLVGSS